MRKNALTLRCIALCLIFAALCTLSFGCSVFKGDAPGDCNRDGKVNGVDSALLLRYLSDPDVSISEENADLNGDGSYTKLDHAILLEYISEIARPGTRFSAVYINGVNLKNFTVVIPEKATDFEKWTAQMLCDALKDLCKVELTFKDDSEKEDVHEILIGNTNREESQSYSPEEGKYAVRYDVNKLVLSGKDYFVAGGVGYLLDLLSDSDSPWNTEEYLELGSEKRSLAVKWKDPNKVLLFIGDGMGANHTKMATDENAAVLYADGASRAPDEKGTEVFWPSTFEYIGECITLNIQNSTTDSAASATALSTGHKTLNGAIGMVPDDLDGDGVENEFRSVQNVREAAALSGMATGVISSDKQTGATPNGFLTHHYTRKDRAILLEQQTALDMSHLACTYLWCSYDSDGIFDEFVSAVEECEENKNGFFIMTEEAMIDKYAEKMDYDNVIRTVKRLNEMTAYAATYTLCHTDTVMIVTADHETGGLTLSENGVWHWTSDGEHTGTNVPVYAMGKGCDIFHNTVCDNTAIAKFIFNIVD